MEAGQDNAVFPGRYSYYALLLISLINIIWIAIAGLSSPLGPLAIPALTLGVLSLCVFATRRVSASSEVSKAVFTRFG